MAASEKAEAAGNQGYEKNHMDASFEKGFSFSGYERDMLQLNLGKKKYMDVSGVSGLDSITDARGSLFADFDNDGDADVLMISLQGDTHHLFRNEVGSRSGFVRVALEGKASGSGHGCAQLQRTPGARMDVRS